MAIIASMNLTVLRYKEGKSDKFYIGMSGEGMYSTIYGRCWASGNANSHPGSDSVTRKLKQKQNKGYNRVSADEIDGTDTGDAIIRRVINHIEERDGRSFSQDEEDQFIVHFDGLKLTISDGAAVPRQAARSEVIEAEWAGDW